MRNIAVAKQIKALELKLTAEEEAAAERIYQSLKNKMEQQLRNISRRMASQKLEEVLGQGQFELRDMLHDLGANALEAGAQEAIKKGGASS